MLDVVKYWSSWVSYPDEDSFLVIIRRLVDAVEMEVRRYSDTAGTMIILLLREIIMKGKWKWEGSDKKKVIMI
jgi:hypothetical protein